MKTIYSPVSGEIINLSDVPDEVFASRVLGDGVGIYPSNGKVYAPFDGTVSMLFPTRHAAGLTSKEGLELMIHIGIDTVTMSGNGFVAHIKPEQEVAKGQLIMEFDIKKITHSGLSPIVILLLTNQQKSGNVILEPVSTIMAMQKLLDVI